MKKLLSFLLCLCMAVTLCAAPALAETYKAGAYTATAVGNNGDVTVEVVFEAEKIAKVTVTEHAETAGLSDPAIEKIPAAIVANQSLAVDTVSGATNTSKAILAAVEDCVKQAGGNPAALRGEVAAAPAAEDEVLACDVVVLGGGAAGMAASCNARDAGASVILLEKQAYLGGNTLISGGLIYATGTTFQKEAGVEDSVEALVDYWMERAEGHADRDLLTMVAEKSAGTVEWLISNGVKLSGCGTAGTSPVPRMQTTGIGGKGFVLPMAEKVKEMGVDIRLETPATALITNEAGEVVGVEAVAADGHKVTVMAKSVVIATGGYDADQEMMRKHSPSFADQVCYANPGNTGDGIRMGESVGADTVFNDGIIGIRGILPTSFADPQNGWVWRPYLLVNQLGQRFVKENSDYPILHTALSELSSPAYLIFDGSQATPADFAALEEKGYAFTADTLEALAAKAHLPLEQFMATVNRYNELKGKEDEDFGKPAKLMAGVGEGPYAAVRIIPTTIGTLGGLKIDADAHVLKDGAPIKGLYAAGAVAHGQFFYREYPASGTSIMICFTMGRIAGTNAAAGK